MNIHSLLKQFVGGYEEKERLNRALLNNLTMAMDQNRKALYKNIAKFSAVGLEMGLAIAIGIVIGIFLDFYLKTSPWLTLFFLFCGIAAAFRSLFALIKKINKN